MARTKRSRRSYGAGEWTVLQCYQKANEERLKKALDERPRVTSPD